MKPTWIQPRWSAAALLAALVAALALIDLPYTARFFGIEGPASLAHLHTGLLLVVAMLARDPLFLRVGVLSNLAVWLWKTQAAGTLTPATLAYGLLAMAATLVFLRLAARLLGRPAPATRRGLRIPDLPRFALVACFGLPLAFTALAFVLEIALSGARPGDPALHNVLAQVLLAKLLGVLILALPLVVLADAVKLPFRRLVLRPESWAVLLAGVGIPVAALLLLQDNEAWVDALGQIVDYRVVVASALLVGVAKLRAAPALALLVLVSLMFAMGLIADAERGRQWLDVFALLRVAFELLVLQALVIVVHLHLRDQRRQRRRLAEESRTDPITGIPNFKALEHRSTPADASRCLGFLLLDQSERMFNSLGLGAQSALAQHLAHCLSARMQAFHIAPGKLALLPRSGAECTDADWDAVLAEVNALAFEWDGHRYRLLPYLGVAQRQDGEHVEDWLLRAANQASEARERGESAVAIAPRSAQPISTARRRSALDQGAHVIERLRAGAIDIHLQPIVALDQADAPQHALRAEVLCRLRQADGGLMSPAVFIPALAASGRMAELDEAVLGALADALAATPDALRLIERLSINIDAQSLASRSFARSLGSLVEALPLPPERLCFEVTETAALSHAGEAARIFGELREQGCTLAIDDFGVGFQSFERLKQLPVDLIKIDGIFVREMRTSRLDSELVRASVAVARAFQAQTVAEFVTDADTAAALREMGVDWGQGAHFGMPLPFSALMAAARARTSLPLDGQAQPQPSRGKGHMDGQAGRAAP